MSIQQSKIVTLVSYVAKVTMLAAMYYTLVAFIQMTVSNAARRNVDVYAASVERIKIMYSTSFLDTQWLQANDFVWWFGCDFFPRGVYIVLLADLSGTIN